jgi:hypothetical protein
LYEVLFDEWTCLLAAVQYENKVITIKDLDHLREIAKGMKEAAIKKEDQKFYLDTREAVERLCEKFKEATKEEASAHIKEIIVTGLNTQKQIIYRGWMLLIIASRSDLGRTFHISVSGHDVLKGSQQIEAPTFIVKEVLDVMFDKWEQIPSPSKLPYVSHYIAD